MHTSAYFKGLSNDLVFKYVFSNGSFLKDLINSYFDYIGTDKQFHFSKIEAESLIKSHNKNIKNYFGDIIATLNTGEIINLEMYDTFNRRNYRKSCNYMCRIYSNQVDINKQNYEECKKVISINFINGNFRNVNKELVNIYKLKNDITNKIIDNGEIEMILVRLDKVDCIKYNKNEKRFIRWLRLIKAESIEELELIAKGDELMEHSVEYVKRYLNGPLNHTMEDYVADREYVAEKLGEKRGERRGKKAGIMETAKKMLNKNIYKKVILEVTGLTDSELKKLID